MYTLHVYTNTILFIYRNCNWKSIIYFTGQHCVNDPSISTLSNIQSAIITKTASKTKKTNIRQKMRFRAFDFYCVWLLIFKCFKRFNSLKNNLSYFFGTLVQANGHQNFYEIRRFFFDLKSNFYQNSQITEIQAIRFSSLRCGYTKRRRYQKVLNFYYVQTQ